MKVYKNETIRTRIYSSYDTLLSMWHTPVEERDIPTSYGTTHVLICGSENLPPLLLFHGVGDNSALMWLYNAERLSQHFRLYAVDTIGGPGKSVPNHNYNKDFDDGRWLDEVVKGLALNQFLVAGVSNGAYLTQYYTIHRPEKVLKAVCMAGSVPVGSSGPMKNMLKIFLPEALFPSKNNASKLLQKLSGKNSHVFTENPVVLDHYYCLLKGFCNMAMSYHKLPSFTDQKIDLIRPKMLYLVGEEDPFAKLGGKEALLKYRMNAQFFPEVGHGINHEISEKINDIMIEYFSGGNTQPQMRAG